MRYMPFFGKWIIIVLVLQGCVQATPTTTVLIQPTIKPMNPATSVAPSVITATIQAQLPTIQPTQPSATATFEILPTTIQATSTPDIPPTIIQPTLAPSPIPSNTSLPASPVVATEIPTLAPPLSTEAPASVFQYVFPIQPANVATFGNCHHDYPASDIFAPFGTAFVAVTGGVIDFVSYRDEWDAANDDPALRGGLSVALIGDDGIRYYGSHLSGIANGIVVGSRVELGQLLGWVGQSGNARSTPAHLHFGISYPSSPDDWQIRRGTLNPVPYLNDWRNGRSTTPDPSQNLGGAC